MSVRVDIDKCTGCGDCVDMCPVKALQIKDGKITVNDDCIDCGACIGQCPVEALSF